MKMRNPKLLCLLRRGCILTFPSGILFHRVANSEFMESIHPTDGDYLYDLTEKGLEEALDYEENVASSLEEDEELEIEERGEEMQ